MAELALGIVGIAPLIGGAIKAYKEVNLKLKLFRHSSKEVNKVHKVLRIQRQVFVNECRLWLKFIIDDDETAMGMALDPNHDRWGDPELDSSFKSRLKDNYDTWLDTTKDISESIEELEGSLAAFKETSEENTKSGKLKRTLERTKDGARLAFNSSDFDKTIEKLRTSNNELKGLREQISNLQTRPKLHSSAQPKTGRRGDWTSLVRIRRASKALYEALMRTWNCGQPGHMGHSVKLFVETRRVDEEVQMNLAIVCRSHTRDLIQSTLVQLEVRSQNLDWIDEPRLTGRLPPHDDDRQGSGPRKRLKVVRFAETTVQTPIKSPDNPSGGGSICGSCDLGSSDDICKELTRQLNTSCLGHLDVRSDESFRHSFYPAANDFCKSLSPCSTDPKAITMDEVLDDSSKNFFSTVDRLKLAQSLVSAVLKFHSTPWLGDFWRLRDLAFFKSSRDEEVSEALRTLHVSEDERLFCGIDNLTLHSLGVALLQIDRWTRVEPGDVLKVRKMALRSSSLGPRYQEITQKCLRCDFGYGADLTKPRLQEAVYDNVAPEGQAYFSDASSGEGAGRAICPEPRALGTLAHVRIIGLGGILRRHGASEHAVPPVAVRSST
ncbi:hypothetical protein CMUS01_09270 [Colletotrichum musicola]|uniref:DUF7580 domain-containing protein n=1 Tax=Colletotrichum musicola TaxID=2175873 RepID=A0A8H6NBJ3_9PEZI|nr:hypothetical protein CMUS01_09270 [Colletotrichum musicola]